MSLPYAGRQTASTRFWWFSSENKIMLSVIVVITAVLFGAVLFINQQYQTTLKENYRQFGSLLATAVGIGVQDRLSEDLSPELRVQKYFEAVSSASPDIIGISYQDPEGHLIYEYGKVDTQGTFETPTYILRNDEGDVIGDLKVYLNGDSYETVLGATRPIIFIVFLMTWIISILAVSLNTYILSKHLRTLVRGVKRISTGDFGYRIADEDLWGELKVLAESFNDMSQRLRAYEDQNLDTITFERNKLEAILLSIADGVVVCDDSGDISILNGSASQMLGAKSPEYLLGTNIRSYLTEEGDKCFEPVYQSFQSYQQHPTEDYVFYSDHVSMANHTYKITVSPIRDGDGDGLGFVMIIQDVTKEAEVDQLKTHFISNVSHELRTPVTTIKSYVDTIYNHGKELDPETYQEFIETIHVETDRLKKLVNDILDFSRLEQGGFQMELEYQDITPVINLTVQSMKVLSQQKNLTLTTAIESNLPQVYINSDSIERVIRNLLSNAIKYTDDGGRIRVRAEVSEESDVLIVSVQDTGIGIPEEHLPHIFDRFYRVENKVHTVKGTGLGLHLVKIAIEKHHHGEVFVKSEVGVGSTFGFRLPLSIPPEWMDPGADKGHSYGDAHASSERRNTGNRVATQEEGRYSSSGDGNPSRQTSVGTECYDLDEDAMILLGA